MPDANLDEMFVMLCDWRGKCVWSSVVNPRLSEGDFVWKNLDGPSQQIAKEMIARVVTLRENQFGEVTNQFGERYRSWLWALHSPEVAVCVLGVRIPAELGRLTEREKDCLGLLAQGIETREIARQLDISLSTIHTHLKRAREKLGLPNVESLISFSARHCYPSHKPLHRHHA